MVLCPVFDIRSCPRGHSVLGGQYGGAWLLGQSLRCTVDDQREKLGLAKAPRLARTRLALCALEAATAPFLVAGMQLPLKWCPHWLSAFCVDLRARALGARADAGLSRVVLPDAALLDGVSTPKAPRSAPSSPARLSRVIGAVRNASPRCPISTPRARIASARAVVAGCRGSRPNSASPYPSPPGSGDADARRVVRTITTARRSRSAAKALLCRSLIPPVSCEWSRRAWLARHAGLSWRDAG